MPAGGAPVDVLPLGIGERGYLRACAGLLTRAGAAILDVSAFAAAARENVQRRYPSLIHELGRRPLDGGGSMLDRLRLGDVNLWWMVETTEKSVFRSPLINALYQLELVALAVEGRAPARIVIDVGSPELRAAIVSRFPADGPQAVIVCRQPGGALERTRLPFPLLLAGHRAYFFLTQLLQFILLRLARVPSFAAETRTFLLASFPTTWSNAWTGARADRTYGSLRQMLDAARPAGYLIYFQVSPIAMWRGRAALRAMMREVRGTPLLRACTLRDVLAILSPRLLWKLHSAFRAMRASRGWMVAGFDLHPLIVRELHLSLSGIEPGIDMLVVKGLRRLTRQQRVDAVVHWGEFQPIEKAIWYGVQGSRAIALAFQHSTASPMFLSYHFAAGELPAYLQGGDDRAMPLPHLIATTGYYAARSLAAQGFPAERICVAGPIRYRGLVEQRAKRVSRADARRELNLNPARPVVVLATTSKPADNLNTAEALGLAIAAAGVPATVLIKCHPLLPRDTERHLQAVVEAGGGPAHCVTFEQEVPLYRQLAAADVLVTNSSATGVEAMALGVLPVFFHNPYLYDLSILYSLGRSVYLAADPAGIETALRAAFDAGSRDAEERRARWPADLAELFHGLENHSDRKLVDFLEANIPA